MVTPKFDALEVNALLTECVAKIVVSTPAISCSDFRHRGLCVLVKEKTTWLLNLLAC